ncbi:SANT domain [Sesbania bispinosa]|nr:SANT domain [Sesbania bispinosa]
MESVQQNDNDDFMENASNDPLSSSDISSIVGAPQVNPRVGHEYQVEVPSMIKESDRLQLLMNPADSEVVHDNSLSFAIGLPVPVTWIHNEVKDGDIDGTVNAVEPEKATDVKKNGISDNGEELKPNTFQSVMTIDGKSGQLGKSKKYVIAPGRLSNSWSDADAKSFLLGLFIFGKNFIQIRRFLENKEMGEILSFYYGKFYKTVEYHRWSECRKMKGRKCMIGQKLFTGRRQDELLRRLIHHVSEESQVTLLQVSKSYVEGRASLEEYTSSLKSTVGLGILVEAVGIGKEKEDLTSLAVDLGKNNRVFSAPTSKAWSSLGTSDIMKLLTGGFRLSKTKSNDLFWEAVWPRLLARGWHSEQPKNQGYVSSKGHLVFLIPGVKKFSRRRLVKGDHYFDSVSDVLSKVVAEPNLLELEEEAKVGSCNDNEPEKGSDEDDQFDYHRQCYLKPRASTYNEDHIKFMVIDTSLVHGGKSSDLREWKSVPVNSVDKTEVDAADIAYRGEKHMRKVNHNKDISESNDQKLTKFTVIDTSMVYGGKLLKVRELRLPPLELQNASKMTGISRESKGNSSDDDSPTVVEDNMLQMYGKKNMNYTDSQKGVSESDPTNQKEAYGNPQNDANKMVESQQNQKNRVSDDNRLKKTIKHQFSRRGRSGHSNHAALPIKRRRLTACAKAETSRVTSGGLGSEKLAFSRSSSLPDAKKSIGGDPVSRQQNGSSIASSADRSLEKKNEESILKDTRQCMSISCAKVGKCGSLLPVTFNIPQNPLKSKKDEMMAIEEEDGQCLKANDPCLTSDTQEVVEESLRTSCDSSMEQQANINPRRHSTRNRPLTARALESLANEFLHVQRRQKKKDIQTHKDPFNPIRRARTRGKTVLRRHCSDHGTDVLVPPEEKHLNGDCSVSKIFASQ